MGVCYSCFGDSSSGNDEISQAEMRARQLAAAEKRASESANRGIGNQTKVQQWHKRQENIEKHEQAATAANSGGEQALRWQVN